MYPLFSPQSLIAEGTANFGIEVAFPGRDRVDFVINYNLGRDTVRRYIEWRGAAPEDPSRRWQEFEKLLSSPRLPSDLK